MPPLRAARAIETDGFRWIAIRVGPSPPSVCAEFLVVDELNAAGIRAYCPLGQRWAVTDRGRRCAKRVRQFPIFPRYCFAGLLDGQMIRRSTERHIESILSDSRGPLPIPPAATKRINDWELAGEWDSCRGWREKSRFRPGAEVEVTGGPFAGHNGVVDALVSEFRIKALIVRSRGRRP